jgi:hypothetical protein
VTAQAQVRFADRDDPVLQALYPKLDARTGLTPVAEPAVASGRKAAREVRGENCVPGFRIAEPHTAGWSIHGHDYLLALFLVTTDAKRGVPAPCYKPEPWVCVLDQTAGGLQPLDCAWIDPSIQFPEDITLDTTSFALNETEHAFGVRLENELGQRLWSETNEVLILFRFQKDTLHQILAVPIRHAFEDFAGDDTCARELMLTVDKSKTGGFFDWVVRTSKKSGRASCEIDSVGTYRWDGARYTKRSQR